MKRIEIANRKSRGHWQKGILLLSFWFVLGTQAYAAEPPPLPEREFSVQTRVIITSQFTLLPNKLFIKANSMTISDFRSGLLSTFISLGVGYRALEWLDLDIMVGYAGHLSLQQDAVLGALQAKGTFLNKKLNVRLEGTFFFSPQSFEQHVEFQIWTQLGRFSLGVNAELLPKRKAYFGRGLDDKNAILAGPFVALDFGPLTLLLKYALSQGESISLQHQMQILVVSALPDLSALPSKK